MALSPESLIELLRVDPSEVDCSGLRLRLDKVFAFRGRGIVTKSGKSLPEVEELQPSNGVFVLSPGSYKVRYMEYVRVPPNCLALAIPRSTLLRMGAVIYTAVWDPGYEGRGEGLLTVFNPHGIEIERGAQIAQLVFVSLDRATKKIYRGFYFRENLV